MQYVKLDFGLGKAQERFAHFLSEAPSQVNGQPAGLIFPSLLGFEEPT